MWVMDGTLLPFSFYHAQPFTSLSIMENLKGPLLRDKNFISFLPQILKGHLLNMQLWYSGTISKLS